MKAPARQKTALLWDLWQQAAEIRREWLDVGLTTEPADRPAAEAAITEIYVRHRRARPAFVWTDSPRAALPHLTGLPRHDDMQRWVKSLQAGTPPIVVDIAAGLSRLRSRLADTYADPLPERPAFKREKGKPWPVLPPGKAIEVGLPFQEVLRQGVHEALFTTLSAIYLPQRAALATPVGWYGNQDASWVAYFDVLRRLGLAHFADERQFETWVTLTKSAGWWWPAEDRCILADRPT